MKTMNKLSVYIHIPFCERKCNYCAFVSFCAKEEERDRYVNFLVDEILNSKYEGIVDTIYFGGGTPSLLSVQNIKRILDALKEKFAFDNKLEITIEVNPNSVTQEKLAAYRDLGINRVSVGVQSLNDASLKSIGRLHNSEEAENCLKLVGNYFDHYSADLIIGLEGEEDITKFAERLIDLGVKHISCYMLEVHKGTPLFKLVKEGKYIPLDDEKVVASYDKLAAFLKSCGFNRYEISNFALDGYESKHNIAYWTFKDYIGYGAAAHSFYRGKRFANADTLERYYAGKRKVSSEKDSSLIIERIMLGLRCFSGVNIDELRKLGYDVEENPNYADYLKSGVIRKEGKNFFLNEDYYSVSDYVIKHLLP